VQLYLHEVRELAPPKLQKKGKAMTDLNYITDGFFITLIPVSKDGEYIYNEVAAAFDGVAKFPVHMKASIFYQIKKAGYTIRKARKAKPISDVELLELLVE
jgi:hypothetical protein